MSRKMSVIAPDLTSGGASRASPVSVLPPAGTMRERPSDPASAPITKHLSLQDLATCEPFFRRIALSRSEPLSRRIPFKPVSVPVARWLGAALAAAVLFPPVPAGAAAAQADGLGSFWTAQGPAPTVGDVIHVPPDGSVDGAVNAVAP